MSPRHVFFLPVFISFPKDQYPYNYLCADVGLDQEANDVEAAEVNSYKTAGSSHFLSCLRSRI